MDEADKEVIGALSVNTLAELNPEVERVLEENQNLREEKTDFKKQRDRALQQNKKLKEKHQKTKQAIEKNRASEKRRMARDICSVTGEDPGKYTEMGFNAVKEVHDALETAGENLFGLNEDDEEEDDEEYEDEEGSQNKPDEMEEGMEEEPEPELPVDLEDKEDYDEEDYKMDATGFEESPHPGPVSGETELDEPELHDAVDTGGYEDYGDPRTDQGQDPNKNAEAGGPSDRTLLANRIKQNFADARGSQGGRQQDRNRGQGEQQRQRDPSKPTHNDEGTVYGALYSANQDDIPSPSPSGGDA